MVMRRGFENFEGRNLGLMNHLWNLYLIIIVVAGVVVMCLLDLFGLLCSSLEPCFSSL